MILCLLWIVEKWRARKHPDGEKLNRTCLFMFATKSATQKIDAFLAALLFCRTCLNYFQTTSDRWSWVSDTCLQLISLQGTGYKCGQGNVCICMRCCKTLFERPSGLLCADYVSPPEGKYSLPNCCICTNIPLRWQGLGINLSILKSWYPQKSKATAWKQFRKLLRIVNLWTESLQVKWMFKNLWLTWFLWIVWQISENLNSLYFTLASYPFTVSVFSLLHPSMPVLFLQKRFSSFHISSLQS